MIHVNLILLKSRSMLTEISLGRLRAILQKVVFLDFSEIPSCCSA